MASILEAKSLVLRRKRTINPSKYYPDGRSLICLQVLTSHHVLTNNFAVSEPRFVSRQRFFGFLFFR
jgi:hypothetical protein